MTTFKQLCCTRELPREDWLKIRSKGIGGSDAAAVVGLNPHLTARELYHQKRGEMEPENLDDNEAVHFGNVLEQVIADEYARRTGRRVQRCNFILQHPEHDFALANIDRHILGTGESPMPPLECKTAGAFMAGHWGEPGTDEVPMHYLIQCQHYLGITGAPWIDLAVLIGGRDYRPYTVLRDDELIEMLFEREREFWNNVQAGIPPEMDFTAPSTDELLKKLYPGSNGKRIDLTEEVALWHKRRLAAQKGIKFLEGKSKEAHRRIQEVMGENALGIFPDGTGYTRKEIKRAGYTVDPKSYFQVRYVKNPKI